MSDCYTVIPNRLFYSHDDTKSLFKLTCNYKSLLVLDYLHINTNRLGTTKFSIEDIILSYGFKTRSGKGNINEQIKDILIALHENSIISISDNIDLYKLPINKVVHCNYNAMQDTFFCIDYNIIYKILNINTKADNIKLLFYYCYLACRMYKRKKDDKIIINGGKAEVCYPSYETITEDTNIKTDTIKQYNDILVDNNLLRIGNCGLYYYANDKNKLTKESPNFYTFVSENDLHKKDKESDWYNNLHSAMQLYVNSHDEMVFLNTREYKSNKSISSYIARINILEKEGKASQEQLHKRDELLSIKEYTTINQLIDKLDNSYKNLIDKIENNGLDNQIEIYNDWRDYLDINKKIYSVSDYNNILDFINDKYAIINKMILN